MATWAIGDVQGCYASLRSLLDRIEFNGDRDRLVFVGDLVNRGARSLEVLRFVRDLWPAVATSVLGNHDLHLLAIVYGGHAAKRQDTIHDVLEAPDCVELCEWLRQLPILIESNGHVISHAGVPHVWDLDTARACARRLERALAGPKFRKFFRKMYGNQPRCWSAELRGMDRRRAITNYFTRMRFVARDGTLDFAFKGAGPQGPSGFEAWFAFPTQIREPQVFGHWASLGGHTGHPGIHAIDTACVWGGTLTAYRLDVSVGDHVRIAVPCEPSDQAW